MALAILINPVSENGIFTESNPCIMLKMESQNKAPKEYKQKHKENTPKSVLIFLHLLKMKM